MVLTVDPHPLLALHALRSTLPRALGDLPSPPALLSLLDPAAAAPVGADDSVRAAVRELLRHGGFKPTGRSKPASEHLLKATAEGRLGPSQGINLAVDLCNVVSLHSGLPISVVDLERAVAPLRVGLAPAGARYVFNASGQVIDIGGLISLFDAEGPCAGPVKDSQRTKTHAGTVETLVLIWGPQSLASQVEATADWYASLLREHGATAEPVAQENH
jgi:DNA/RNA-binding domain of Phe-tRNA-synthetase-like protein